MIIQEQAAEIRSLLVLQGANMKRMRDYIELVRQLHTTPINYCTAVSEVVRRRSYSQAFLMVQTRQITTSLIGRMCLAITVSFFLF